ncbi:MAG: phosphoenolpyruvate--protein phosphotransferase [Acidobacteria bacterium]|nr:phosphoenolpyruvate--protein phosphotransferase [Acidobacteriota bacterium]
MRTPARKLPEERLEGIGVCQGVAIGTVFLVDDPRGRIVRVFLPSEQLDAEIARFREAVRIAQRQVQEATDRLRAALGGERVYILETHLLMLKDYSIGQQVENFIRENQANAEWAVRDVTNHLLDVYAQITDDYLRERGSDIVDVSHRLIKILSGTKTRDLNELAVGAIIIADDLLPSVAADLDPRRVLGFVTNVGGWASHTSIIARSLNIPAVVGVRDITSRVRSGETIIIDGTTGAVIINPSPETYRFYSEQRERQQQQQLHDIEERELPAVTRDGYEVKLRANIELMDEIDVFQRFNAAGIGLYRSEFLYSQSATGLPTEDEQYEAYKFLAEMSGKEGAVIRTFDLGGDKLHLEGFKPERNPALGLRAIRLSLSIQHIFRTQIRAILRAAEHSDEGVRLKILLPFVSNLDEIREAKQIIADAERELRAERMPHAEDVEIGVMVEVPAAVIMAEPLAREADFFSLGTNDLTQSVLAVDRGNENVNALFDPLHPAVLRAIKFVSDAAQRMRIPINVCGEMASNPAQVIILLGLGLRDLSMTPSAIPAIRRLVRSIDLNTAQNLAAHAIALTTPAEVHRYVQAHLSDLGAQFMASAHFTHFVS